MRKKGLAILFISVLSILATGCNKQILEKGDKTLYPVSSYEETLEITMGDVMPFYDGGVWNIYHLQNSRGSNSMYYHPISRLTTTDFLTYTDEGIAIDFEEKFDSPDAAIGTGSFIRDEAGVYHCFYTGHNAAEGTGLPFIEVIRHAVSRDQKDWTKVEEFNLYGECNDFRDPYVYYDETDKTYYMLVTTRANDIGVIKRYASADLSADDAAWKDCGIFFSNDDGTYNMECPSYVEYNGYYYLAFSEQGDNRITHYRFKTEPEGEWKRFERDSIDSAGFYAGRLEKAGDELYAFAWCAKLTGGSVGEFDWGGNLVVHKISQSSSGELNAVITDEVLKEISNPIEYKTIEGKTIGEVDFTGNAFRAVCLQKLKKTITRLNFKFCVEEKSGDFGLTFNVKGTNNRLGSAVIAFEPGSNTLTCYNNVSNVIRYGDSLCSVSFVYSKKKEYEVNILMEDEIMTVYLDNTVAMTVRLTNVSNKNFAFYSNKANTSFRGIQFYE